MLAWMNRLNGSTLTSSSGTSEVRNVGSSVSRHLADITVARRGFDVFVDVLVKVGRPTRLMRPLMRRCE